MFLPESANRLHLLTIQKPDAESPLLFRTILLVAFAEVRKLTLESAVL